VAGGYNAVTLKPSHLLLAACSALIALPAAANDTAIHMGRYGPGPVGGSYAGRESAVAMVREHLTITLGKKQTQGKRNKALMVTHDT
jgi:hypothetical protein